MKGIVFNLFEDAVTAADGPGAWDALLSEAHAGGAYTSLGSYSDEELVALVVARSAQTGMPADEVVRGLGRAMLPAFYGRWPELFEPHANARAFTLTLNDIIHPEVRKLYPGADVPDFGFDQSDPDVLVLTYRSHRRMCALAEGLLEGAAAHYGEQIEISQPQCMLHGAEACRMEIAFARAPTAA